MAISVEAIRDVQTGVGLALRTIDISGVNASDGTPENVAHGLGVIPAEVFVVPTVRAENAYEAPTTYLEVAASRDATNLSIESLGTQSSAKGTIFIWYNKLAPTAGEEDAGEGVL